MPNALIEDLNAEHHNFLLEKGNLVKARRPCWTDNHSWKTLGFSARISRVICDCGAVTESLLGLFRDEETPSGAKRSSAVKPSELSGENHPVITLISSAPVCAHCVRGSTYFRK